MHRLGRLILLCWVTALTTTTVAGALHFLSKASDMGSLWCLLETLFWWLPNFPADSILQSSSPWKLLLSCHHWNQQPVGFSEDCWWRCIHSVFFFFLVLMTWLLNWKSKLRNNFQISRIYEILLFSLFVCLLYSPEDRFTLASRLWVVLNYCGTCNRVSNCQNEPFNRAAWKIVKKHILLACWWISWTNCLAILLFWETSTN